MAHAILEPVALILASAYYGVALLDQVNPKSGDYYTIRMENGDNQDAAGNPPSIILTDFAGKEVFGVFEGSGKSDEERCRNYLHLPDGKDKLYNGLKNGEAPIQSFETQNGFNLKYLDIQPGGNAICISYIIVKGSGSQARQDEIFLPLGELVFQCGGEWNWGTMIDDKRQRCAWLDAYPEPGRKPIKSLRLDMEKLAGYFEKEKKDKKGDKDKRDPKYDTKGIKLETLCKLYSDNFGLVTNRNDCANPPKKRSISTPNTVIDTDPNVKLTSTELLKIRPLNRFAGSGFVTSDKKFYNSDINKFDEFSITSSGSTEAGTGGTDSKASDPVDSKKAGTEENREKPKLNSRAFGEEIRRAEKGKRESNGKFLEVRSCVPPIDGGAAKCTVDDTISVVSGINESEKFEGISTAPADPKEVESENTEEKHSDPVDPKKAGTEENREKLKLNSRAFGEEIRRAEKGKRESNGKVLEVRSCVPPIDGGAAKCTVDDTISVGSGINDSEKFEDIGTAPANPKRPRLKR